MLKLIKLEWKRNNISRLIRNAVIMTAVLLVFIMITAGEAGADVTTRGFFNKSFIHASVELFTHMSYMVFTGVMLAGLIVGEYEKGTIRLLFSYPIKRQKIMLSKIFAVWIFNFTALVISKLLMYAVVLATGSFTHIPSTDIPYGYWLFWVELLLGSAAMISISFLALPVGIKRDGGGRCHCCLLYPGKYRGVYTGIQCTVLYTLVCSGDFCRIPFNLSC